MSWILPYKKCDCGAIMIFDGYGFHCESCGCSIISVRNMIAYRNDMVYKILKSDISLADKRILLKSV